MTLLSRPRETGFRLTGFTIALLLIALAAMTACAKDATSQKPRTEGTTAESATPVILERTAEAVPPEGAAASRGDGTVGDASYSLTVNAPASLAQGEEGVVKVTVTPKPGWKMNKEFPTKIVVTPPDGVTLTSNPTQAAADAETFDEHNATFAIKFQAASPGDKQFKASFKFAVCTDATCDPKKQDLTWAVAVQ